MGSADSNSHSRDVRHEAPRTASLSISSSVFAATHSWKRVRRPAWKDCICLHGLCRKYSPCLPLLCSVRASSPALRVAQTAIGNVSSDSSGHTRPSDGWVCRGEERQCRQGPVSHSTGGEGLPHVKLVWTSMCSAFQASALQGAEECMLAGEATGKPQAGS